MSSRYEIQWTRSNNKFITWGSEFSLYQVEALKEGVTPTTKLSSTTGGTLLASISSPYYVKCIDVYPKSDIDVLLAVGQANGKLVLSTFGSSVYDSQGLSGKEFVPRHPRQCNTVAWKPSEPLIAAGLDKHRSEHSILLWDVMKSPTYNDNGTARLSSDHYRPVAEYGLSESAHSLAWFHGSSDILAAGMNLKHIKIIDFRDPSKAANVTLTKAVFGVTVDPNNLQHLASYVDNQIHVWDSRNFEKPILIVPHSKTLLKISWCPTKHNLLGALHRDSGIINLYDIQRTVIGSEEVEPSLLEREVRPGSTHNLTSFSWHHTDEYRLVTISLSGSVIDYRVFDRITLNWAPNSNVVWTYGRKTMKCISNNSSLFTDIDDVSEKIKQRAIKGYGLKDELWKNGELAECDMLAGIWNWLHLSKKLVEEGILRGYNSKHPGVRDVLKLDISTSKSESVSRSWSDLGSTNSSFNTARMYKHEDRDKALYLCGWYFDKDQFTLATYLDQLVAEKAYTRAAAIAVFNLKVRTAIDILNRGAEQDENLNVVAMALAGFTDDKNSMWRQFCSSPKTKLNDPYLRAMFAFLTADNFNYDNVLNECEISVDDRVAFACMFLPDAKLYEYLKGLCSQLMSDGNLDGMLLTGNNADGIRLLQKYLDITSDIQSTVLIAVRAFTGELLQDVQDWITGYRNLLDSWQLWNERALFDIMFTAQRPNDKPPQQVYVSCNFCGKSISAYMQGLNRGRGPFSRMGGTANKLKMSSCPNCRKPLPRCVICLMHMGTTTGIQDNTEPESNKMVDFSNWFTWCQSCRHGGHSSHMIHWFQEHSECPVTACTCRCFSVDAIGTSIPT